MLAPIIIFLSKKDEEKKLRAVFLNHHKIMAPPLSVIKTVK